MTTERWTTCELTVVIEAPHWHAAWQRLPDRTEMAVRNQWRRLHDPHRAGLLTGRPPQTPDERRVAQILTAAKRTLEAARVAGKAVPLVDGGWFLTQLRAVDWRRWDGESILQGLPLEGHTR